MKLSWSIADCYSFWSLRLATKSIEVRMYYGVIKKYFDAPVF